jgi:hypothetical protein
MTAEAVVVVVVVVVAAPRGVVLFGHVLPCKFAISHLSCLSKLAMGTRSREIWQTADSWRWRASFLNRRQNRSGRTQRWNVLLRG